MSGRNLFTRAALTVALAGLPAKSANAKTTFKATVALPRPATLGGKVVKEGSYTLEMDASKITLNSRGKVIAEAPAEWKDGTDKASTDNVITEGGVIKEIHFGGKTRYLNVQD